MKQSLLPRVYSPECLNSLQDYAAADVRLLEFSNWNLVLPSCPLAWPNLPGTFLKPSCVFVSTFHFDIFSVKLWPLCVLTKILFNFQLKKAKSISDKNFTAVVNMKPNCAYRNYISFHVFFKLELCSSFALTISLKV